MFTKPVQITVPAHLRQVVADTLDAARHSQFIAQEQAEVSSLISALTVPDAYLCVDGANEHMCSFDDDGVGTCIHCDARIDPSSANEVL